MSSSALVVIRNWHPDGTEKLRFHIHNRDSSNHPTPARVSLDVWELTRGGGEIQGWLETDLRPQIRVQATGSPRTKPGLRPHSVAPSPGCLGCWPGLPPGWRGTHGGGARSGGGRRHSHAHDGTGSSQSGPAARTQSARSPWGRMAGPVRYTALRLPFIYTNVGFANESDEKRLGGVVDVGN